MSLENLKEALVIAINNAREGITIIDATLPDQPLIFANKGFQNITGYSHEEIVNRNCRFLHRHLRQQPGLELLRNAIRNQEAAVVEVQNFRRNGTPFWNRLSITPVFEQEKLRYFIGIQEDITADKDKANLQQALKEHQLIAQVTAHAQEDERRHIGEELHDSVNPLLATAKLYLSMAANPVHAGTAIEQAKTFLDQAISEIRVLSAKLVQQPPQQQLATRLEQLVASLQPVVPFSLTLHNGLDNETQLGEDSKLMLFRVVQEQLNNIIKHAGATQVSVTLKQAATRIHLTITDDGIGFDPAQQKKGIGFTNMKSRLRECGGRMVLQTKPGAGCQLHVRVPRAAVRQAASFAYC